MIIVLAFLAAFIGMEAVAWLAHKYIMHGFLWYLHADHHKRDDSGFFEKNDYFFLLFSIPGITCIFYGVGFHETVYTAIGAGISAYGACYFLVHDIFIHQRFKLFRNSNNRYMRAVRRAHKVHHKTVGKHDGSSFGMLFFPLRYWKDVN